METKIFNNVFNEFKSKITKKETFSEGVNRLLEAHALVFIKELSTFDKTFESEIWEKCVDDDFTKRPLNNKKTIAYYLYHLTRIEDITSNILIARKDQIFYKSNYQTKLNSSITTTGNELNNEQIVDFSRNLNIKELKNYRKEVGLNTINIIKGLTFNDLKRKVAKEDINKILEQKSVSEEESAIWLLTYWGNKNVLSLLTMPLTRHHMVHLNDCNKIVNKLKKDNSKKIGV